jgi:ankyrin repeat protein
MSVQDGIGNTPLHLAIKNGSKEIVKLLIDKDSSMVNEYNSDSETALQVSVRYQSELVSILIDAKADVNADVNVEDKDKNMPLHWIARNGQSDIIGKVIESEANL